MKTNKYKAEGEIGRMKIINIILVELVILLSLFTFYQFSFPYHTTSLMKNEVILSTPEEDILEYTNEAFLHSIDDNIYIIGLKKTEFMNRTLIFFLFEMRVIILIFMITPLGLMLVFNLLKKQKKS